MIIRPARLDDLPLLPDIEIAAGRCFRDVGMPEVADAEPPGPGDLARHQRAGLAWVTVDPADLPVAYLVAEPLDGNLHVEQVSVHPAVARRRLGRQLLEHLAEHAVADAIAALTLTTFVQVPWNAPYYERCGFRVLGDDELTPGLRAVRRHEAALGLDHWPRVCMRRDLDALRPAADAADGVAGGGGCA